MIVLDTNALLLPVTQGTDLVDELQRLVGPVELIVPSSVHEELQRLAEGVDARGRAAKAALRHFRLPVEPTRLPGDDGLLDVARRKGTHVVTNDRRLQKEARQAGLVVIASRGAGRLFVTH